MTDLFIADAIWSNFTPDCFDRPMGGSELEIVLITEALAAEGLKVVVGSRAQESFERNGVSYVHVSEGAKLIGQSKSLWIQRNTAFANEFSGRIIVRVTDPRYGQPYDWNLLARPQTTLVTVSDWQRKTFTCPIANHQTIYPPCLPINRREGHVCGPNWVFTSHISKGWPATLQIWKRLKKEGLIPPGKFLVGLFPREPLPPPEPDWAEFQIKMYPNLVTPDQMREVLEDPTTDALFQVNTYPETFGMAQCWAVRAGLPVHILCKAGLAGLAESLQGDGATEDWSVFVHEIKAHVNGDAFQHIYLGNLQDLSPKTRARKFRDVLGI